MSTAPSSEELTRHAAELRRMLDKKPFLPPRQKAAIAAAVRLLERQAEMAMPPAGHA